MLKALLAVGGTGGNLRKGSQNLEGGQDFVGGTRSSSVPLCYRVPHNCQDLHWVQAAWISTRAQVLAWVSSVSRKVSRKGLGEGQCSENSQKIWCNFLQEIM